MHVSREPVVASVRPIETDGRSFSLKDVVAENPNYVAIIDAELRSRSKPALALTTPFKTIEADRDYFLKRNGWRFILRHANTPLSRTASRISHAAF